MGREFKVSYEERIRAVQEYINNQDSMNQHFQLVLLIMLWNNR